MDAYFTGQISNYLPDNEIHVRFLVRIDDGCVDSKTLSALNLGKQNINNFHAKALENLHSKVILIDEDVFYLGSANWYWYSLHESLELVVKGKTEELPGLIQELEEYWKNASYIPDSLIEKNQDFEPRLLY